MTQHAIDRLNRVQPRHIGLINRMLAVAGKYNDAALTSPVNRGLNLVVIVRHYEVITLFYRESRRVTPQHLGVQQVVNL